MKKYELSQYMKQPNRFRYNAGTKARNDTDTIYRKNGFTVIYLPHIERDKFFIWLVRRFFLGLSFLFRIDGKSEVHIQYPATGAIRWIIKILRFRGCKITLMVHDIEYERNYDVRRQKKELVILSLADEMIVHTPAMMNDLRLHGITPMIKILYLFDYLASSTNVYREPGFRSIVYAGNIKHIDKKGEFVYRWLSEEKWNIRTYLYGTSDILTIDNKIFSYEGVFEPDDISGIKGAWGVVWDGDLLTKCDGRNGNYLRFNSSHKISLYLACEKPVIVWTQSSLRDFIETNKIGFAVDSLLEIPERLAAIHEAEYEEYLENVRVISKKIRNGEFLSSCIR